MRYLTNAFSLNMLPGALEHVAADIARISVSDAAALAAGARSAIGHADTAAIVSGVLGVPVAVNRATVVLIPGDELLVAQYIGPRLPEGTTKLPSDATIRFYLVTLY